MLRAQIEALIEEAEALLQRLDQVEGCVANAHLSLAIDSLRTYLAAQEPEIY